MATAIVLSGGTGRRFGSDKAFIRVGGETLAERIGRILTELFDRVIFVGGDPRRLDKLGLEAFADLDRGKGNVAGIRTGLLNIDEETAFVTACDMPFLDPVVIRDLMSLSGRGEDVLVPIAWGRRQTLHAVYSRSCVDLIEGDQVLPRLLDLVDVRYVSDAAWENTLSFENINTPEDQTALTALTGIPISSGDPGQAGCEIKTGHSKAYNGR